MRYKISYKYLYPGPAGPSKGSMVQDYETPPKKGETVSGIFGRAIVTAVSRVGEKGKG